MILGLEMPDNLHPDTKWLVQDFAKALAEKLHRSEKKYGYSNGWLATDWQEECRQHLLKHVGKGDPLDVAAYCAFMWLHRWPTVSKPFDLSVTADERDAIERLRNAGPGSTTPQISAARSADRRP